MKHLLALATATAVLLSVTPSKASENEAGRMMTKGTKNYQSRSAQPQQETQQTSANEADVTMIEPAAGGDMPSDEQMSEGKSFKEEMRLPRKN